MRGQFLPGVKLDAHGTAERAFAAEAGVTASPRNTPFSLRVSYRLERYDFPGGANVRIEQFDALQIAAGLRLGQ